MTVQLISRPWCIPYVRHTRGLWAYMLLMWFLLLVVLEGVWLYMGQFHAAKSHVWPALALAGWSAITIVAVGTCAFGVVRRAYHAYLTANRGSSVGGEECRITVIASPSFVTHLQQMSDGSVAHGRFRVYPHGSLRRVLWVFCVGAFVIGLSTSIAFRSWATYVVSVGLGISLLVAAFVWNSAISEWLEVKDGIVTRLHKYRGKWRVEPVFSARHSNVTFDMTMLKPSLTASTPSGDIVVQLDSIINPYGFVEALYSTVVHDQRAVIDAESAL